MELYRNLKIYKNEQRSKFLNHYHFAPSIEEDTKDHLSETSNYIASPIHFLHALSQKLNSRYIYVKQFVAKTSE